MTCAFVWGSVLRRIPCLVSCSLVMHGPEILNFWTRGPHFHFALGCTNHVHSPAVCPSSLQTIDYLCLGYSCSQWHLLLFPDAWLQEADIVLSLSPKNTTLHIFLQSWEFYSPLFLSVLWSSLRPISSLGPQYWKWHLPSGHTKLYSPNIHSRASAVQGWCLRTHTHARVHTQQHRGFITID